MELPSQCHQRLPGLRLHIRGVNHRKPTGCQSLAGDVVQHVERIIGGSLIGFYFMFALKIAESFRQASLAYVDNPTALHLRAMNMLFEGLQERGALIIVPSSAVDTMNLGGLAGLTALAQNAQTMISKTNSDSPNPEDEK